MGGMGGFGGGFGGMGGFGGGMGGFGGGMGMFNVPSGVVPRNRPAGLNLFSVNDDLNLVPDQQKPTSQTAPAKPSAKAEPAPAIELPAEPGVEPETAWDRYFASHNPAPAAVRQTVRNLWSKRKYNEVISLIQAALRHKQAQPWMYEVLTMALLAAGRGPDEVERAVMSAVDFAENPLDLMLIGAYVERLDLPHRALQIYRQVSQMMPYAPEPYTAGLRVAERLDDLEGIRWATVGILSQAWPGEQQQVWERARRVAAATLERLRSENRVEEARQFEKALDDAVVRDCVAIIHWNGDADLDLLVREPGGTVCSLRNPRSAGGGVLMGDNSSAGKKSGADGMSEIYVCPRGFSGQYTLLVRRIWGRPTADRVTVDLYVHCRTDKEQQFRQTLVLKGDEAAVQFTLADGRRTEPLRDFQVAKAAADQMNLRQHILAQQLAGGIDPLAMANLIASRQASGGAGAGNNSSFFPFPFLRGAVGYQPVIITLPEGTNLMAMAVISADRRYVRFTGIPLFSGVAEVHTFNMVTGENAQGRGGTGGRGFGGLGFGQGIGNVFGGLR